jgi:hypothetical protein
LAVGGHFDHGGGGVVQDQLALRARPSLVVADDALVVRVLAGVGVARPDPWSPRLHPQRDDLLILEGVVQVHVAVEQVLDVAPVAGLAGQLQRFGEFGAEAVQFGGEPG